MKHTVTVANINKTFEAKEDQSLLQSGLDAGLLLPYSCRGGSCGACKGKLISGDIAADRDLMGLTDAEQADGQVLLCQAKPTTDLTIEAYPLDIPSPPDVKTFPGRVKSLTLVEPSVMEVTVSLPPNQAFDFKAGQYVDFILRDGRKRSYSIANAPHQTGELIFHVKRIDGGRFSTQVFEHMKPKTIVRLQAPNGTFFVRDHPSQPIIMAATGTGYAPVRSMILDLLERGDTRPIHFYWGARHKENLYALDEASAWADQYKHIHFTPLLSAPRETDHWQGRTGYVQDAVIQDFEQLTDFQIYLCGSPEMIDSAREIFAKNNVKLEDIFSDSFDFATY